MRAVIIFQVLLYLLMRVITVYFYFAMQGWCDQDGVGTAD